MANSALAATVTENQFADSTPAGVPVVSEAKGANIAIDLSPAFVWKKMEAPPLDFGQPYNPSADHVVSVTDTGAIPDGKTDDTGAFQKTLDSLKDQGGGIAFVPGGTYLLNGTLKIPAGVELRGVSEGAHHTSGLGSVLMVTSGQGQEDGVPFITMNERSGLRGLTIWYPNQDPFNVHPFPWTIRVMGQDVGIRNVDLGNVYKGIDMASADTGGHYVDALTGMTLSRGIVLDRSSKRGVVLNVHFNPHFYVGTHGTGLPGSASFIDGRQLFSAVMHDQDQNNIAFTIGSTKDELWFNDFNYRSNIGMVLTGGFDGEFRGLGLDGAIASLSIEGNQPNPLTFTNTTLDIVPGGNRLGNGNLFIHTENEAHIEFINSLFNSYNFVAPDGAVISNANVSFREACFSASATDGAIQVESGRVDALACTFSHIRGVFKQGFTLQPTDVLDLAVHSGKAFAKGCVGVNSFNTTLAPEDAIANVIAAQQAR